MGKLLSDLINDRGRRVISADSHTKGVTFRETPNRTPAYVIEPLTDLRNTVKIWQRAGIIQSYKPVPKYGPIVLAALTAFCLGLYLSPWLHP